MPRRGKKRQENQSESDESEEDWSQTTASQGEVPSDKECRLLAGQVCNLLLTGEIKKIPVKKAVIRKFILKKHRKFLDRVMKEAKQMMKHIFGYEIVTFMDSYILVNTLSSKLVKYQSLSDEESYTRGLLADILMAIFMSEGKISAGALETNLKTLDVNPSTSKVMIQDFLRHKYLLATVDPSSDPPLLMYKWGDRAHAEFCKKEMLELICKVYGNMKPTQWTYQWNVIQEELKNKDGEVA